MLRLVCECGKQYRAQEQDAGKQARCKCGRLLQIPGSAPPNTNSLADVRAETFSGQGSPSPFVETPPPPRSLGHFVLQRKLGEGAMGQVWLAQDTGLRREVAIKVLPADLRRDAERRRRFEREATLSAQLHHPNVVTAFQLGDDGGLLYLVMEYVNGGSLADRVRVSGPLPWQEATRAIRDAASGLAAAHDLGLVHRDIKPANLLRTTTGVTKVADFGLARAQFEQSELTQQGSYLGTPSYMSPEQWEGKPADARSDLYALICSYYYLLTGKPPFEAENWISLAYQHRNEAFPDPRHEVPGIPAAVCAILERGSRKLPAERYSSGTEMVADLTRALEEYFLADGSLSRETELGDPLILASLDASVETEAGMTRDPLAIAPPATKEVVEPTGDFPVLKRRPADKRAGGARKPATPAAASPTPEATAEALKKRLSPQLLMAAGNGVGFLVILAIILGVVFFRGGKQTPELAQEKSVPAADAGVPAAAGAAQPESAAATPADVFPVPADATGASASPVGMAGTGGVGNPPVTAGGTTPTNPPLAGIGTPLTPSTATPAPPTGAPATMPAAADSKTVTEPAAATRSGSPVVDAKSITPATPAPAPPPNPFRDLPPTAALPAVDSGEDGVIELGNIHLKEGDLCFIRLKGADRAFKGKLQWGMANAQRGTAERDWEITLGDEANPVIVALLSAREQKLTFREH